MNKEDLRRFHRYLETEARGQAGQQCMQELLSRELEGTGLVVKLRADEIHDAPFDLEVLDGERILVGIENKDLAETTKGTWVKGPSKKRKLIYARQHSIRLLLTTVTMRDTGRVGFKEGIVNGSHVLFDYDVRHLIDRILGARRTT